MFWDVVIQGENKSCDVPLTRVPPWLAAIVAVPPGACYISEQSGPATPDLWTSNPTIMLNLGPV